MAEKKFTRLTIEIPDDRIESLKSQLRAAGVAGHISATEAVGKALDLYGSTAKSVRLDEPERKQVESRAGLTVPIRNSKDILRAFDKMTGGPDTVVLDLDPGIADVMRDVGRGLGYGLAEFSKIVIEDSYANAYLHTIEQRPVFFNTADWNHLQNLVGSGRIRTAGDIVMVVRELYAKLEAVCPSTATLAPCAEPEPTITFTAASK